MCGIAGIVRGGGGDGVDAMARVRRMCTRMAARGPDAEGQWEDVAAGVTLGHRRLSILDLDPRADQPMVSPGSGTVIVFNGEIYNFRELRAELEADGHVFRTHSDTEVLVALYDQHGTAMLRRLRGMFAFALWDPRRQRLLLARDPYGIKPLYVAKSAEGLAFASQVKSLLAGGGISLESDPVGRASFWLLGSVVEPRTWYRDVAQLPAGHFQLVEAGVPGVPQSYCDIADAWRDSGTTTVHGDAAIQSQVRGALEDSVRAHLVSDVPVGVFLSGGIDSGSLAGLMRDAGASQIQGVTVAFGEFEGGADDEVPGAVEIARLYGIQHHVRRISEAEFHDDLPQILDAMDQPSIDGFNTWFAAKAVAELGLKVVVSGVGGDELFQGYSSFDRIPRLVHAGRALSRIPGGRGALGLVGACQARRTGKARWRLLPKLADSVGGAWFLSRGLRTPDEVSALMHLPEGSALPEVQAWIDGIAGKLATDPRLAVGQLESTGYLRNQLLRDSDWASMAHSVELRTPLVDARLLDDLRPLLPHFQRFPGKQLLARAPSTALPPAITGKPKTGFSTPVRRWLADQDPSLSLAQRVANGCLPE